MTMTSDELAERVRLIRGKHEVERENAYQFGTERKRQLLAEDLPFLLSVLDDVAEGLAAMDESEFEYHVLASARGSGRMDAAKTLGAVRDLHLRREGEG